MAASQSAYHRGDSSPVGDPPKSLYGYPVNPYDYAAEGVTGEAYQSPDPAPPAAADPDSRSQDYRDPVAQHAVVQLHHPLQAPAADRTIYLRGRIARYSSSIEVRGW